MRILWLVQDYEVHAFDLLAQSLRAFHEVDFVPLSADEQGVMSQTLSKKDLSGYDRVLTTLRTKKEIRQWRAMREIPNHVVFEYDACQNYISKSRYKGRFSLYFRRLGFPKIIVSGFNLSKKLSAEGFSVEFMPKGYDPRIIKAQGSERAVELGFIGSLKSGVYQCRKEFLESCVETLGLQLLKTAPGEAYNETLNNIRYFLSADIGLGEYMAKNFEAMAAGCVLITYSQGIDEDKALGFRDMENVVLYRDYAELVKKLQVLRGDPRLADQIAGEGALFAREHFAYDKMGEKLADILSQELESKRPLGWRERLGW